MENNVTLNDEPRMFSETVAQELNINPRTLRRYLDAGVLTKPRDILKYGDGQELLLWTEAELEAARQTLIARATNRYSRKGQ